MIFDNLLLPINKSISKLMDKTRLKWSGIGVLSFVVVGATSLNVFLSGAISQNVANIEQGSSRAPASLQTDTFGTAWEQKALASLENNRLRDLASVGATPSLLDRLTFSTLKGRYRLRTIDGRLKAIELPADKNNGIRLDRPVRGFVTEFLPLLASEAEAVENYQSIDNGTRSIEKLNLIGQEGEVLAQVEILLDQNKTLLSLSVN